MLRKQFEARCCSHQSHREDSSNMVQFSTVGDLKWSMPGKTGGLFRESQRILNNSLSHEELTEHTAANHLVPKCSVGITENFNKGLKQCFD